MKKFTIESNQYKKLVSIIMPTRNRMIPTFHNDGFAQEGGLITSLESIYNTTEHKDKIEIILRVHLLDKYDKVFDMKLLKGDRYGGYVDLWRMWNELAAAAEGEFVLPFSDDVTMKTVGWEGIMESNSGKVSIVKASFLEGVNGFSGEGFTTEEFLAIPFIHSKIIELQGYMELHASTDTKWTVWNNIAKKKGYNFEIIEPNIQLSHKCMGGEHVRDELPPTRPDGITAHYDIIEDDVQRVINGLEVA